MIQYRQFLHAGKLYTHADWHVVQIGSIYRGDATDHHRNNG